jgi:hypothetical protein
MFLNIHKFWFGRPFKLYFGFVFKLLPEDWREQTMPGVMLRRLCASISTTPGTAL